MGEPVAKAWRRSSGLYRLIHPTLGRADSVSRLERTNFYVHLRRLLHTGGADLLGGETATASAASARLKQQFELPPQMFRVCQCLKLARARGRPFGEPRFVAPRGLSDTSQEFALGKHPLGFEAGRFSCFLQRTLIDMRGQVLFTGTGQHIGTRLMPVAGAR